MTITESDILAEKASKIAAEDVFHLFSPSGPISNCFKNFELRQEQTMMLANVLEAFNHTQIALIEAGTGTGKSMAYLVPAILWAHKTGERIVISTNTIPLQEQLLRKDIPMLLKALNVPIKAAILKGMGNFVCLRKLHESLDELLYQPKELEEIQRIEAWTKTPDCRGERSFVPFPCSPATWERIVAESDACNKNKCPHFKECYFFKMKKRASDASILIVNHHLLFADMIYGAEDRDSNKNKDEENLGIIPDYTRLIIDEAHNIEDVAMDFFASRLGHLELMKLLSKLLSEKGGKQLGKLSLLKQKIELTYKNDPTKNLSSILMQLSVDIAASRQNVLLNARHAFDAVFSYIQEASQKDSHTDKEISLTENRLRIHPKSYEDQRWSKNCVPLLLSLSEAFASFGAELLGIVKTIKNLKDQVLMDSVSGILFEIEYLSARIQDCASTAKAFTFPPDQFKYVQWIEVQALKTMINVALVNANLNVAELLANRLFSKIPSVILCSATLTTVNQFTYVRSRLGLTKELLENRTIKEYLYESPFDYPRQLLLGVTKDLPLPNDHTFNEKASQAIIRIVEASHGNAFVLFTSYTMLTECFNATKEELVKRRFHPLKQGDADRQQLLKNFVNCDRSVLFGTDSFWEGIDIGGEALRCVIIVKLPFKSPSDPIVEARSEAIIHKGGDPFNSYSLPQAIVKFKQGFGRLIRQKSDRGCVICLDQRIITKRYGIQFLTSLPASKRVFDTQDVIIKNMAEFYKATHHLVKKQ